MGLTEGARRATGVSPSIGCLTPSRFWLTCLPTGRRENQEEYRMENSQKEMVRKRRYPIPEEKRQIFLGATINVDQSPC